MAETAGQSDRAVDAAAPSDASDAAAAPPAALRDLMARPQLYSFFMAVRLLEGLGGGAPLGHADLPRRETVRVRALDSLSFPAADITEVLPQPNPWGRPPLRYIVTATFLGLYGPASPLPTVYTELIVRPQEDEDPEDRARLRDFLDLFHHRLFCFVYRALSKYRYHLTYTKGGTDPFTGFMLSLVGRGTRGMRQPRPISEVKMIRYAGLLTQYPRCTSGLEGLVRDFLGGMVVRLEPCTGRWLRVEDRNQVGGTFCTLGADMIVGSSVYDRTGKFRISIGPMGLKQFMGFLPNAPTMAQLRELVRLYLIDPLEFDVEVWLRGEDVPPARMGLGEAAMLGWTSWPSTGPGPDRAVVFQG